MRFNSQGGKGNVNENVFPGVVEVLRSTGDKLLLGSAWNLTCGCRVCWAQAHGCNEGSLEKWL